MLFQRAKQSRCRRRMVCVCVWRTVLRLTHYLHVEWPCGLVMMDYVCGDRIQCSQGRGLKEAA